MLVWINGTFGVGKTTTARAVVAKSGHHRVFDPESVGDMLVTSLHGIEIADFQDLAAWRQLVPLVARHVEQVSGQELVAVQTVLDRNYWLELRRGLGVEGFDVLHVVLDADRETLVRRIRGDEHEVGAKQWRLEHVDTYLAARKWMTDDADLVVDVAAMTAEAAADLIIERLR